MEFKTLLKKEFFDKVKSPLTFAAVGMFVMISSWLFFNYLLSAKEYTTLTLTDSVIRPSFGNLNFILMLMIPLLTMDSFAGEEKEGTLTLLLKSSLSINSIYFSKFLSTLFVTILMYIPTVFFLIAVDLSGFSNWEVVLGGYLGLFFCSISYISIGIFCSSLAKTPLLSAISSLFILLSFLFLVFTGNAMSNPILADMMRYASIPYHFESMSRGLVTSFHLVYFISLSIWFWLLTRVSLMKRDW